MTFSVPSENDRIPFLLLCSHEETYLQMTKAKWEPFTDVHIYVFKYYLYAMKLRRRVA